MDPVTRVTRTYYAMTALFTLAGSLIWGVNTLFLLEAGLSVFQAFAANAVFTAAQVVFEVPTGVVADARGRRISVVLAAIALLVGTLAYVALWWVSAGFFAWAIASVVLGLGFAFWSGALDAWFVDALDAAGGDVDLDARFARGAQVFGAAMLVGTLAGGALGQVSLGIPYLLRSAFLVVLIVMAARMLREEGFRPRVVRARDIGGEVGTILEASWRHGWRVRPVRLLMLLSLLHMGFLIWGWYAWQPHFLDLLGERLIWVAGVIAALVSLLTIAGNALVAPLRKRYSSGTLLAVASGGLAVCMVGVGMLDSFVPAVGVFLLGMLFYGTVGPVKQAAFHRLIPTDQRATITSFDSLVGNASGAGAQVGLARLAEDRGYAAGYLAGGVALLAGVPISLAFRRAQAARPAEREG